MKFLLLFKLRICAIYLIKYLFVAYAIFALPVYSATVFDFGFDSEKVEYGYIKDSRDGQKYRIVTIGSQTWMAENLNYEIEGSFCYDDDKVNCNIYGRLYTWDAAIKACPIGFNLPRVEEWGELLDAVGGIDVAGKKLKSKSRWANKGNGTDEFDFSILPAGYRYSENDFSNKGTDALFWTASLMDIYTAHRLAFNYKNAAGWFSNSMFISFSVRCIKATGSVFK